MDINILIGILSIIVSICVGFGTFYISDKRATRNRWQNAKDTVLRDLSKSLGEGNIPDASIIRATIRSVLRSQNAKNLTAVSLEEIMDDLLRQITVDPFLEADRRKQLQADLIDLKESQLKLEKDVQSQDIEVESSNEEREITFSAKISSLIAGLIASIVAATSFITLDPFIKYLKVNNLAEQSKFIIIFIAAFITVLISIISVIYREKSKKRNKKS